MQIEKANEIMSLSWVLTMNKLPEIIGSIVDLEKL